MLRRWLVPGIQVPDDVETIVYDDNKNSIWFKAVALNTAQASATRINATGELNIIGGTAKFAGATGRVTKADILTPLIQLKVPWG